MLRSAIDGKVAGSLVVCSMDVDEASNAVLLLLALSSIRAVHDHAVFSL
jgi:hypothetical protein